MSQETRHEQYLRILTNGIAGESDYEAVKYLVDMGYSDSKYMLSKMNDTYGKVTNACWVGPNSRGLDYIDELKALVAQPYSKQPENKETNQSAYNTPKKIANQTKKSSWVVIAEGVAVIVFGAAIIYLLKHYFEINLN